MGFENLGGEIDRGVPQGGEFSAKGDETAKVALGKCLKR